MIGHTVTTYTGREGTVVARDARKGIVLIRWSDGRPASWVGLECLKVK